MARPRKQGLEYFSHDTDSLAADEKLLNLRALYGLEGYGFYFAMLERIYRTGKELPIRTEGDIRALLMVLGITRNRFSTLCNACMDVGLFERARWAADRVLTSHGIQARFDHFEKKREDGRARWEAFNNRKDG
jgi:hypothetical protein